MLTQNFAISLINSVPDRRLGGAAIFVIQNKIRENADKSLKNMIDAAIQMEEAIPSQ